MQIQPEVIEEVLSVLETLMTTVTMTQSGMNKALPLYRKLVTELARNTSYVSSYSFAGISLSESLLEEVKALLAQRQRVQAVKRVRDVTGQDIRESKNVVDAIQAHYHYQYPTY